MELVIKLTLLMRIRD